MRSYCRICCRDDLDSSLPLYHRSEISSETVLNMMAFVTGLKVNQGDGLPQQICRICLGQLLISYELKRTSIVSQSYFQKLLLPPDNLQAYPACDVKLEATVERETLESRDVALEEGMVRDDDDEGEVMFFCCWNESCTENFKSEDQLVEHFMILHKQAKELNEVVRANDEFVCIICARGFNDEKELLQHSMQVKRKAFKCDVCYFITYDQAEHKFHSRSHSKLFRCVCGFTTNRKFSLQRHLVSLCCEEIYGKNASFVPVKKQRSRRVKQALPARREKCDITRSELISMGFSVMATRDPSKFYCCISKCEVVQDSELQCVQHYEKTHTEELQQSTTDESNEKEGVKCKICRKVFQTVKDLQIHREDSFQPLFQCNTCGNDGFTRETALGHSERACTVNRFTCPCGFLTDEPSSLTIHFNSGMCNRGFGLLEEMKKEDTIKVLPVSNADQEEVSNLSTTEQQSDVKRYICKHCGASRKSEISLRNHQRLEKMRTLRQQLSFDSGREVDGIPGKMYNCKWCNEPTNNLTHLIQCMANKKEKLRCKKCYLKFFSKRRLELHYMRGCRALPTKTKLLNYNCPYCERRFYHPSVLERHVTMDHRIDWNQRELDPTRKYICTTCGFRFRRKFCLNRHMIVHSRKRDEATQDTLNKVDII
ncbi:zinc finger protein 616-like [Ochlerotatus camptorhynchus]|uniref:zinc finger protein 616-like n=1 Tax=Ochlerotatus camptorhynchus TaxID=644619 RepID=UPI0031DAF304